MNRDFIFGIALSLLVHATSLYWDTLFPAEIPPLARVEPKMTIELFDLPQLELEEPDVSFEEEREEEKPELAPPMTPDLPGVVTETSFVQPMQPPPPPDFTPAKGVIVIPGDRGTSRFRNLEVFEISKLDQPPQARLQARPQYPFEMRRAGIAGEVVVDFIVDTNGDVYNAYAVRSTQREFEAAAVQAVSRWKFRPGRKEGRKVMTHMQVPIVFTLNDQ